VTADRFEALFQHLPGGTQEDRVTFTVKIAYGGTEEDHVTFIVKIASLWANVDSDTIGQLLIT